MNLNFFAPVNELGFGVHSFETMNALANRGHEICLTPIHGNVQRRDPALGPWLQNWSKFDVKNPSIMIFHSDFLNGFSGTPRIGFDVFEVDQFAERQLSMLKSCDYLFVTSWWGKSVLSQAGFDPERVFVVNEGYNPKKFFPNQPYHLKEESLQNAVGFIHVGKWEGRKSSSDIVKAYLLAATKSTRNSFLTMHCYNPFIEEKVAVQGMFDIAHTVLGSGKYKAVENAQEIRLYGEGDNWNVIYPRKQTGDIANFYNQHHFGLFASKAEGWNLPLIEAIACGLPCITTNVTAQSEYINNDYPQSLILRNVKKVPANDGVWFHGDRGNWYEPSVEEITHKVTEILNDPEGHLRLSDQCLKAIQPFTWDHAAQQMEEALAKIEVMERTKHDIKRGAYR